MMALDFFFPLLIDGQNIVDLAPSPQELGAHFWRHLLFIAAVAVGYLGARGGALESLPLPERTEEKSHGPLIASWIVLITLSWTGIQLLSAPVATYLEHYTRFDHLGWVERRLVYVFQTLKSGGYFVLLALMFTQFSRWRWLIAIVVPVIGIYEGVFSFGARIETLTILLGVIGFYHFRVAPISLRKGAGYMLALAVLFSGIGLFRASGYDLRITSAALTSEGGETFAEFGAVFNTGFHLYSERAQGTLPAAPPLMFVSEAVALIPFIDHQSNNPMYWYAKHYFPESTVPPQTMGVIADSAIWGGEWDLLFRSLLNGALFAWLARWFLRRRGTWLPTVIYVFACATCVLTLKYSVFYQVVPFARLMVPVLLITEAMRWLFAERTRLRRMSSGSRVDVTATTTS